MKQLIIIGAGGMGRCTYCIAEQSVGFDEEFQIKGFFEWSYARVAKEKSRIVFNVTQRNDTFVITAR